MGKLKMLGAALVVIIAALGSFSTYMALRLYKDNKRLSSNNEILINNNAKIEGSKKQLTVKVGEMKQIIEQDSLLKSVLKDSLEIKQKNINSLTHALSTTKLKLRAALKDTVIYIQQDTSGVDPPVPLKAKKFDWSNEWYDVNGLITDKYIDLSVEGEDTIYYVAYNEKYKKWFLPKLFEKPTPVVLIWNENPHNKIEIVKSLTVPK